MTATTNNIVVASLMDAAKNRNLTGIYIKSVRIAATHNPKLDQVLCITWSMPLLCHPVDSITGVKTSVIARPEDTYIYLPTGYLVDDLEDIIINAAWTLGAWDMCRMESPPINSDNFIITGIANDFGQPAYSFGEINIKEKINGRVSWLFIPLYLASPELKNKFASKDNTLNKNLMRDGLCGRFRAAWMQPKKFGFGNEHIYQLGRQNHGNRSKNNTDRRA